MKARWGTNRKILQGAASAALAYVSFYLKGSPRDLIRFLKGSYKALKKALVRLLKRLL